MQDVAYRVHTPGDVVYMVDAGRLRRVQITDITILVAQHGEMRAVSDINVLYIVKPVDGLNRHLFWQPTGALLFDEREAAEAELERVINIMRG